MTTTSSKRIKECGWFYHAPVKRKDKEQVLVPPTSQIPGLNADYEPEEVKSEVLGPVFRDTDTKYVRLAKQGGRQNLLQFKENPNMREREPVGYPRAEWFYLEDNAIEDAGNEEPEMPYQFRVPEYMAHEQHQPSMEGEYGMRRAPFAYDRLSAYDREGDKIKDKTLKIPETLHPGFGIRGGKPLRIKSEPKPGRTLPSKTAKVSQIESEKPHLKYLPFNIPDRPDTEKEKPKMSKVLSYAYDKEWQEELAKWQVKQDKLREKYKSMMAAEMTDKEPVISEYRTTIGKQIPQPYKRERGKKDAQKPSGKEVIEDVLNIEKKSDDKSKAKEKDLFKLTKFKNVPSKVDSHNAPVTKQVTIAAR